MSARRIFVAVAAPTILVVGLGVAWGVNKGTDLAQQVEAWVDDLEHSSEPVEIRVAGLPIVSTMYVDGERVGRFDRIVVLRDHPGDVDSLRIVARLDGRYLDELSQCYIEVDPEAMEDAFPTEAWKQVMSCHSDMEGLVPFGSVVFDGTSHYAPIVVAPHYVKCDQRFEGDWTPVATEAAEIAAEEAAVVAEAVALALEEGVAAGGEVDKEEIREAAREARRAAAEASRAAAVATREASRQARSASRDACADYRRAATEMRRLRDELRRELRNSTRIRIR